MPDMKNANPPKPRKLKTLRKRPSVTYEVKYERGKWYAYRNGVSQGFNTIRAGAMGIAERHARADADVGMEVTVEVIEKDGSRRPETLF
jgi:hypothetical protein